MVFSLSPEFTIATPNIRPVDHFQLSPNRKADMWNYFANEKISFNQFWS